MKTNNLQKNNKLRHVSNNKNIVMSKTRCTTALFHELLYLRKEDIIKNEKGFNSKQDQAYL